MADKDDKVYENVPGKYYVDSNCDFCETCIELSPENFAAHNDEYAYVKKQPMDDDEENACPFVFQCYDKNPIKIPNAILLL